MSWKSLYLLQKQSYKVYELRCLFADYESIKDVGQSFQLATLEGELRFDPMARPGALAFFLVECALLKLCPQIGVNDSQ